MSLPHASFRRKKTGQKDEGLWLLSFADLSMILISFFILMLSFAKVDRRKMEAVVEGLKTKQEQSTKTAETPAENILKIEKRLNEALKTLKLNESVAVTYDITGLSIELKDDLLFESGSAQLKEQSKSRVLSLLKPLGTAREKYHFRFEGHTDDQPIAGGKFRSNWELSAARAIALMQTVEDLGVSQKHMSVLALADTQPKVSTKGLAGSNLDQARAKNRRVIIRVE